MSSRIVSRLPRLAASLMFALAPVLFGPATAAAAAVPAASGPAATGSWSRPLRLELPAPARQIRLAAGTDPDGWAETVGLSSYRTLYRGHEGAILETAMRDDAWRRFGVEACNDGSASCETAACQSIQVIGDVEPGGNSAEAVKARLVRVEPERVAAGGPENEASSCRNPAALPADEPAAAGHGTDLTLDLDVDRPHDERPDDKDPNAPAERQPFEFVVERSFNALGGARLEAASLPEDTSDWTLLVSAGCSEVAVPMDGIEPARVPGQVTALVEGGTAAAVAAAFGLTVVREIELDSTDDSLAVFAGAGDVAAVVAAMLLDARVSAAQPEFVYRTSAEPGAAAGTDTVAGASGAYSDPFAALVYGPRLTGVLALHPQATGGGQLVAVIDTGVDTGHPDLDGRIGDAVDVTGRGLSADLHGTAVAGIIAANADNAEGGYGVAPGADILAIKACQPVEAGGLRAKCWTSTLVKALDLAMSRDAAIINMSLAGPPDDLVARYVALAAGQDRLIVAGAGNNGPNAHPAHPAALPDVLAVTAVDASERRYRDGNLGDYIDVSAPGVDIVSPAPGGSYPPLSGTSMASAHVAGAAALLKELSPLLGARELGAVLRGQSRDLGEPGQDAEFGAGLMDACRAATAATADAVTCTGQGGGDAL